MSETSAALDRFEATYRVRYANQPRVSRDPEELERIVGELEGLAAAGGPDGERAKQLHASYGAELEQIRAARAVPYAVPAARLRLWSDLARSRYRRGFAGRDRRTRDLGLLLEIVNDLELLNGAMRKLHQSAPAQGLAAAADAGEELVRMYRAEAEQIRASRQSGAPADQGSRLATLANEQFGRYARLFSGKSRVSRHAATLERILASLREIAGEMRRLKAEGFDESNNNRNITVVDGRIQAYTEELSHVRSARADVSVASRAGALGAAANEVFQAYRESFAGKKRADVSPDVLDLLFEDMWPIAREMDEIDAKYDDDVNARNLQLVMDTLVLYAREYDAIVAAKQPSP